MFASRSWKGETPASVTEVIRVDSDILKVMGRIMATSKDDEKVALGYMDDWNVRTLSAYLGQPGPKATEHQWPDPASTNWLQRVNFVLCQGDMGTADKHWLAQYKETGLAPCNTKLSAAQMAAAKQGEKQGLAYLNALLPKMTSSEGLLGTRAELQNQKRDLFAEGTLIGQWGLPPEESVYLQALKGSDGQSINGANGKQYRMHFKAPEVSQFRSFTVYGTDNKLMAHNTINRHSRGDRTLKPGPDGMYTIELSAKGDASNPNWLPIPEKDAYIIMRLYGPNKAIREGKYPMPVLEVVK